jgi:signal transduction histidine kinase/ActR/RegA family two-component response regulator
MKIRSHLSLMATAVLLPLVVFSALAVYQLREAVSPGAAEMEAVGGQALALLLLGLVGALVSAIVASKALGRKIELAIEGGMHAVAALGEDGRVAPEMSGIDELDRLNDALIAAAQLVGQKGAEREQVLQRAQEARAFAEGQSRGKVEFLATLGHELRNPLAPINTAAQILKLPGLDGSQLELSREIIERQVEHLTRVVDDLVDVSRVSRGLIVLQRAAVDVNTVLEEAAEQVRSLMETRGHKLVVSRSSIGAWVSADRERVVQVMVNLLHNAAKFTPHGGRIEVVVAVSVEDVTVTVRDNGDGISRDLLPNVFELFMQSERSPEHAQGGLGLGLSLVKGLVELHAGRVFAHSEGTGKGSEFTFELPRLAMVQDASALGSCAGKANDGLKIVIVDDNVDAAESLAVYLRASFGYGVSVYADAQSALEHMALDAPDALVLDIGLPEMNGYELARKLRDNPDTAGAVLIAVTGYGSQRDRDLAREAGFDHHLTKPADPLLIAELLTGAAESGWSTC